MQILVKDLLLKNLENFGRPDIIARLLYIDWY